MPNLNTDTLVIEDVWGNYVKDKNLTLTKEDGSIVHIESILGIDWSCNLGWGIYTFYFDDDGNIFGDSETMDCDKDKTFVRALMNKFVDKLQVMT